MRRYERQYRSSDEFDEALSCLALIVGPVLMFLLFLLYGLVLQVLWGWFIVPAFREVPDINVVEAMGITLIVGFLTAQYHEESSSPRALGFAFLNPILALGFGWVIHLFM